MTINFRGGDKIAADVRIIRSNGIKVDNSSLTGEAEPQPRITEMTHRNPLETQNLAFYGSMCVEGDGLGLVIRTANNTVIGQIASIAQGTKKLQTFVSKYSSYSCCSRPLGREIDHFVKLIGILAFTQAVVFFAAGFGVQL